ncbi:MAG: hypothetical protein ABIR87_01275 [Sphingomicrobium sp.]
MAHVLLGWELGANRGHAVKLRRLGSVLRAAGHEVSFAVQRIDVLSEAEAGGSPVWQAPVTPRLLISGSRSGNNVTLGLADIVGRLGFDDSGIVSAMVAGWRRLIGVIRPDVVVGEYAPFLLLAARGHVPSIALGTAFSQPPADMDQLPQLVDGHGAVDPDVVLAAVNRGLASVGTPSIEALPRLFEADRMIAESFTELDPYAAARKEPLASPLASDFAARVGSGKEVFVYAPERITAEAPLWRGLAASGLPIRVHPQRAPVAVLEALGAMGFAVEPEPIDFATIARRSRMVVSHGGQGFVSAAMAAGLPQVVCHHDLEKGLNGLAVAREGLGGHVSLTTIDPAPFGADLAALYRDDALAERARVKADDVRDRGQPDFATCVVEAVAALA